MLCNGQYGHFMVSTLHDILQDLGGGGGGGVQGCRILGVQLHGRLVLGGVMMRGCSISSGGQCSVISTEWL